MIKINPMVVFRDELDFGGILFHPASGEAVGLNPVARIIWLSLTDGLQREGILARLMEQCEDLPPAFEKEVDTFLGQLEEAEFITSTEA